MFRQRMVLFWVGLVWVSGIGLAMGLSHSEPLALSEESGSGSVAALSGVADEKHPGRIRAAIRFLATSSSGKALLERAESRLGLEQDLKWGEASKTDAVLIRHFNPKTGQERRERKVTVYLKKELQLDDLAIDLAHELVHAGSRAPLDPYDPELTPSSYIRHAIEGEGGEVDAVLQECRVSFELASQSERFKSNAKRCSDYLKPETGGLDRLRILRDFYRVGEWDEELLSGLGEGAEEFPWLSNEKPHLYSSTGHAPYPVALLREFEGVTEIACENARNRLRHHGPLEGSFPGQFLLGALYPLHSAKPVIDPSSALFIERRCKSQ
jgi:hypothetical protein